MTLSEAQFLVSGWGDIVDSVIGTMNLAIIERLRKQLLRLVLKKKNTFCCNSQLIGRKNPPGSNHHKMLGKAFSKNKSLLLNQFGSEG